MTRKIGIGSALALVLMLVVLTAMPDKVYGAVAIDTEKNCTITFDVSDTSFQEVNELPIDIHLYQVATVSESGRFTATDAYENALSELADVDSETSAEKWQELAAKAAEVAEPQTEEGTTEGQTGPGLFASVTINGEKGNQVSPLETGLYLVMAQPAESSTYRYTFQPYLVALPGNLASGTEGTAEDDRADSWVYDVTVGLKPEQENRLGDLVISKTIDTYQPLGNTDRTMFVFQVEVSKTEETAAGAQDQVYYSNTVALDFSAAGTQTLRIEDLPAGATATVTEVYSGASYTIPVEEATVVSAPIVAEGEVGVSFNNRYDGGLNGGTGVVNHFEHDGATWNWTTQ